MKKNVDKIFQKIDLDHTGKLHWHEFLAASISRNQIDEAHLKQAFDHLDHDHKGWINRVDVQVRGGGASEARRALTLSRARASQPPGSSMGGLIDHAVCIGTEYTPSKNASTALEALSHVPPRLLCTTCEVQGFSPLLALPMGPRPPFPNALSAARRLLKKRAS